MLVRPWRRLIPGREGDMYRAQVGWAAGTEDAMIAGVQFGRSSNASSYLRSLAPDLFRPHEPFHSHLHYLPLPITSALVSAMGRVLLKVSEV